MPRWSGPPIQTKGHDSNLGVMLAITLAQMRRFGASPEEIEQLKNDILHINSFDEGCDLIRQFFPLDIDLITLNNCKYNTCTYPGCPGTCEGRQHIKIKPRRNGSHHTRKGNKHANATDPRNT